MICSEVSSGRVMDFFVYLAANLDLQTQNDDQEEYDHEDYSHACQNGHIDLHA